MKALMQSVRKTDWLSLPIITACSFWLTLGGVTLIKLAVTAFLLLGILGFGIVLKPFVQRRRFPYFSFAPSRSDLTHARLRFSRYMSGGILVAGMLLCVYLAGFMVFFVTVALRESRLQPDCGSAVAIVSFACNLGVYVALLALFLGALHIDRTRKEIAVAAFIGPFLIGACICAIISL